MEQTDILRHAVEVLERIGVPYMVVGSIASMAYGESRYTRDVDIVAEVEERHIPSLIAGFPSPEFYLSRSAVELGVHRGVPFNVIHPATANKIDVMLPADNAWSRQQMSRRRPTRILPDRDVMTAAPEDVIIGKLWYYSEGGGDRHLRDIAGILRISGEEVDRGYVELWAKELGYLQIWENIIAVADAPDRPMGPGVP